MCGVAALHITLVLCDGWEFEKQMFNYLQKPNWKTKD